MRSLAPVDFRKPFDMYKILARLLDGSKFDEFKPNYGSTIITGTAHNLTSSIAITMKQLLFISTSHCHVVRFIIIIIVICL